MNEALGSDNGIVQSVCYARGSGYTPQGIKIRFSENFVAILITNLPSV